MESASDDVISSWSWFKNKDDVVIEEEEEIIFEQFVHNVEDFSSQYGSEISVSYTAFNIRGPPSNFPHYGDYPQAFVMRTYGTWWDEAPSAQDHYYPQNHDIPSQDYLEVSFEREVYPLQVSIFETYNPGAVVRIWARGPKSWLLLWEGEPEYGEDNPRLFSPPIRKIDVPTKILRLEFNHSKLPYYTELDAVLLKGREPTNDVRRKSNFTYTSLFSNKTPPKTKPVEKGLIMEKILASNLLESVLPMSLAKKYKFKDTGPPLLGDFHVLPDETMLYIMKLLDLKSLSRMSQVNRHFYELACDPILYRTVDLKPYWHCAENETFYTLLDRCDGNVHKLDVSWCGSHGMITPGCLYVFIKENCTQMTHLRMNCCKVVDNNVLRAVVETCSNLQELSLRAICGHGNLNWAQLAGLTKLRRLDLYRTDIQIHATIQIIRSNPGLQHLNLGSSKILDSMDDVAIALGTYCPDLISVDFWKSYSLSATGLRALGNCKKLEELDVGWCLQAGGSGEWLSSLPVESLRKLFLGALRGVCDRDLAAVVPRARRLQQLDLLGVRSVTHDVCARILAECPELKLLDVSFCDQIQEAQVVQWREAYPHVSIKRSFQSVNLNAAPRAPILAQNQEDLE